MCQYTGVLFINVAASVSKDLLNLILVPASNSPGAHYPSKTLKKDSEQTRKNGLANFVSIQNKQKNKGFNMNRNLFYTMSVRQKGKGDCAIRYGTTRDS